MESLANTLYYNVTPAINITIWNEIFLVFNVLFNYFLDKIVYHFNISHLSVIGHNKRLFFYLSYTT